MSIRIRDNLGGLIAATNKLTSLPTNKAQIGKVFGVVIDENTPSKELFERSGGWNGIGTVFYLDYEQSKNIRKDQVDLNSCKVAKPFHASIQNYPLIGELIYIIEAPAPASQINNIASQKYYTGTLNLWNNNQQNSLTDDSLGKTFTEKADIRNLLSFEGDRIYQGRKGNGIRFGSTVKSRSNINEWSNVGEDGDPITIIVNGYVTTDTGSFIPNVEEINKELSSIYMTSTQKLPLKPGALITNPILSSIPTSEYTNPQIILNSDRITLNSKKDDIVLISSGFIELNTDSVINLNSTGYIHLNIEAKNKDSRIMFGTKPDGTCPSEPVLLGGQTHDLLLEICNTLRRLAGYLAIAAVPTSDGPICIQSCNDAGTQLFSDVNTLIDKLGNITSTKVYTI